MAKSEKTSVAVLDPSKDEATSLTAAPKGNLVARMAARFDIQPGKMTEAIKQTAFRQRAKKVDGKMIAAEPITDEQFLMLLVVADQYHLNPFTREIYAFPQDGGIVPIVSVDGWIRITNEHPQLESMELIEAPPETEKDDYYVTCVIQRKDRSKPTKITEYLRECYRDTDPWNTHPRRMTRHKALIQCARVAFGYSGIFDPDEGERIYAAAIDVTPQLRGKPDTREPRAKQEPIDVDSGPTEPLTELLLTLDQVTVITDKLREDRIEASWLLAQLQVGSLGEIPRNQYQEALKLIANFGG